MSAEWIDACRHPVVPGTRIHAAAASPLLLVIVWLSWTTVAILLCVSITMAVMQMKGREPIWVLRRLQVWMRSGRVQARPLWYRRRRTRMVSYDAVDMSQAHELAKPVVYADLKELAIPGSGGPSKRPRPPGSSGVDVRGDAGVRPRGLDAPRSAVPPPPLSTAPGGAMPPASPTAPASDAAQRPLRPKPFGPGRSARRPPSPLSSTSAA